MNLRKWQVLYNSLIVLGMVLLIIAILVDERLTVIFGVAGLASAICGFILQFIVWKCPHCDKRLPTTGTLGMDHCPYCGNNLF